MNKFKSISISKRIISIGIILLISSLSLTGCKPKSEPANANANTEKKLTTIKIPTQTGFNEFDIADELGYFKEEGIKIEYTGALKPGTTEVQTVITGDNDVFTGHPSTVAKAVLAGAKIKIVAPGMVDNEKFVHMNYLVKEDSPLKSAKDIANRKVKVGVSGTNSCNDLILLEWLAQNNVPESNAEFVLMPDTQQEQALKQGLIDVANLHPAAYKKAFNDGGVRSLFTSYEVVKTPAGGSSIRGFSDKFIKENPEAVKGFVRALYKTHLWINSHQDEAINIVAKRLNLKPENVTTFWYDERPEIQKSYIQAWLDLMVKHNVLKPGQITADKLYTNEYNTLAKK